MGFFRVLREWVSGLTGSDGRAVHMTDEDGCHTIAFDSLKVVIVKDGPDHWHAQSLDIDYAANGLSLEEVQRNFERGLTATIKAHLQRFGNIDRLMKNPPKEDIECLDVGSGYKFSMLARHDISDSFLPKEFPFHSICYELRNAA